VARQAVVRNGLPLGGVRRELANARPDSGIRVEGAHADGKRGRILWIAAPELGSASRAEDLGEAVRRLERSKQLLTAGDRQRAGNDVRLRGRARSRPSLTACAVAVARRDRSFADVEAHTAAKAAAGQGQLGHLRNSRFRRVTRKALDREQAPLARHALELRRRFGHSESRTPQQDCPSASQQRRTEQHGQPTLGGEHLECKHGVGDRDVLQELRSRLEVGHERSDPALIGHVVPGSECGERVGVGCRNGLRVCERRSQLAGPCVLAEHELGERSGVSADRALGLGRARVERPASVVPSTAEVTSDQPGLHRPDRPPPAPGRGVRPTLAVCVSSAEQPRVALLSTPDHEQREPRRPRRVSHASELTLPLVALVWQAGQPVLEALPRLRRAFLPVRHRTWKYRLRMAELREVVYIDGVRTAFGRATPDGYFAKTRADDMAVKAVREVLRRNPQLPPEKIDDVVFAATAQVGDQGLTLGRDVALLAGLPKSVPGFAVDRMCAGALTATTAGAGEIAMGAADFVLVGGVEHMGHHPMGEDVDFNPRFIAEQIVDESAAVMGQTAENLHDAFPYLTKKDADAYAVESQRKAGAAWDEGIMDEIVVPMSVFTDDGWTVAARDEFLRPETTMEALAGLRTPFRAGGRVTAGNSAGLTDGATAALIASADAADEIGLAPKMRLVGFAYAGVEPELMGLGPVPATHKVLERAELTMADIGLFEVNEPFAVQVLSWCEGVGIGPDDPRLNPYGGAIACGHPLAATGVRLMAQLARGFRDNQEARYGLTALCIGLGMGAAILWENLQNDA